MIRVLPDIPKIRAHWDWRSSKIPTYLEVPMSDGTVVQYVPEVRQEQQSVLDALQNIRNMKAAIGSYQYKEKEEVK